MHKLDEYEVLRTFYILSCGPGYKIGLISGVVRVQSIQKLGFGTHTQFNYRRSHSLAHKMTFHLS